MALSIDKSNVSMTPWGDVDKTALRDKLLSALESGTQDERAVAAISEVYAVIKERPFTKSPSSSWWGPHHEIIGDVITLNRDGLGAAAAALAGARAKPNLDGPQWERAAAHLRRHYREIDEDIPEGIIHSDRKDSQDSVVRIDFEEISHTDIKVTPQGYIELDGAITRIGVFDYYLPNGDVFRELRLPEEVFKKSSMDSFANVPVTNDHPPCLLNAQNTKDYQRGMTLAPVRKADDYLEVKIQITDQEAIEAVKSGKRQLSNGYTCNLDRTPGVWNGQKYDAIQRNIVGNHVAIVDRGRAGSDARLRMDSVENIAYSTAVSEKIDNEQKGTKSMATIVIEGVTYQDVADGVATAVTGALQKKDAEIVKKDGELKALGEQLNELKGKFDAAEEAVKKAEENKLDDAAIQKMVADKTNERLELLAVAMDFCDKDALIKLDSPIEIMKAVIVAISPDTKFDADANEAYIRGKFDASVLFAADRKKKANEQVQTLDAAKKIGTEQEKTAEDARADAMAKILARSRGEGGK